MVFGHDIENEIRTTFRFGISLLVKLGANPRPRRDKLVARGSCVDDESGERSILRMRS